MKMKHFPLKHVGIRATDQETSRVVAVINRNGAVVGAGCLLDGSRVLTCRHVAEAAQKGRRKRRMAVRLIGVEGQPKFACSVAAATGIGKLGQPANDIALLRLKRRLNIPAAEFAAPLKHNGKRFSVLGFPEGDSQGRNAGGRLHGADAAGLVQMDGDTHLLVEGGFSGAPVWSPDLGAFVGMVVTELSEREVAWCIPSRLLSAFHAKLTVRFRIPREDRPVIHDYWRDDPNTHLFGTVSKTGSRSLKA
jgi:hypothetical protein